MGDDRFGAANGSVFLCRALLREEWWRESTPTVRNLWLELFMTANWQPGTSRSGANLAAGELVTTWRALARRLAWTERGCRKVPSVADVRWAMKALERAGEVRVSGVKANPAAGFGGNGKPATDGTADGGGFVGLRVTLVRWAFYAGEQVKPERAAAEVTAQGSAVGTTDTLKNRSLKNNNTMNAEGFDAFWKAYPKKRDRNDAAEAWKSLDPDAELQARILVAVEAQKQSREWREENGRYITHPAKWLNDQRWEDIIEPTEPEDVGRVFVRNASLAASINVAEARDRLAAGTATAPDMIAIEWANEDARNERLRAERGATGVHP